MNEEQKQELAAIEKEVVADVKAGVEQMVEAAINKHLEKLSTLLLQVAKELIPGPFDDIVIDTAAPLMVAKLKQALLDQAEKISDKV